MSIFRKLYDSMGCSLNGLWVGISENLSLQLECVAFGAGVILCWFLKMTWKDTLVLLGSILLVMCLELLNTALEEICNLISLAHNPVIGKIKDMASAAVLLGIVFALAVWSKVFLDR